MKIKNDIQESFQEFASQNEMHLSSTGKHAWYSNRGGAIKALKILQNLIGGEIQKGQRVLDTYTTRYIVENGSTGYVIKPQVKDEFIAARVKANLGV